MSSDKKPACKCANCFDVDRYMYSKDGKVVPNTNPPAAPQAHEAPPIIFKAPAEDDGQYAFTGMAHWLSWDPSAIVSKPAETKSSDSKDACIHNWNLYQGLNFDDFYCTKCGQTKPANPAR